MELLLPLLVVGFVVWMLSGASRRRQLPQSRRPQVSAADMDAARRAAEEDVVRFGEELQRLDTDVRMSDTDEAMLQDWQRALDSYDAANRALEMAQHPDEIGRASCRERV